MYCVTSKSCCIFAWGGFNQIVQTYLMLQKRSAGLRFRAGRKNLVLWEKYSVVPYYWVLASSQESSGSDHCQEPWANISIHGVSIRLFFSPPTSELSLCSFFFFFTEYGYQNQRRRMHCGFPLWHFQSYSIHSPTFAHPAQRFSPGHLHRHLNPSLKWLL